MKILTCDGGGVFGYGITNLLSDKDVSIFDAFGGNSVSSFITAWYASGKLPSKLNEEFPESMKKIFSRSILSRITPFGPKWPNTELIKAATSHFDFPFKELKKPLFIVAMDFANRKPKIFSTLSDPDYPVYKAVIASVSAPTYFKPFEKYVDGGLFANNPSVVTIAGIRKQYGVPLTDMNLFSIGTGILEKPPIDMTNSGSWSALQWAPNIIDVMLTGTCVRGFDYICRQLDFKNYVRWDKMKLDGDWDFDSISKLEEIKSRALALKPDFDKTYATYIRMCTETYTRPTAEERLNVQ